MIYTHNQHYGVLTTYNICCKKKYIYVLLLVINNNNDKKLISQKITIVLLPFFKLYEKGKLHGKLVSYIYSQITDFKLVAKNVCFMLNLLSITVSDIIWDI